MRQIEIILAPNGESHLETKGFVGGECREASRLWEQALGIVASDRPTADMYAQRQATESARLGSSSIGGSP